MKKLITMTEYISTSKEVNTSQDLVDRYNSVTKYAQLLQTPLSLSQFIPCNEKGEPLVEQTSIAFEDDFDRSAHNEYQKALDRVLFEGWVLENGTLCTPKEMIVGGLLGDITAYGNNYGHTIEELISEEMVELIPTETCMKQIGL